MAELSQSWNRQA